MRSKLSNLSKLHIKQCCKLKGRYFVKFPHEFPVIMCESHWKLDNIVEVRGDALFVYDLNLKKGIKLPPLSEFEKKLLNHFDDWFDKHKSTQTLEKSSDLLKMQMERDLYVAFCRGVVFGMQHCIDKMK